MSKFAIGEIAIITHSVFAQFPVWAVRWQIRAIEGEPDSDAEYLIDCTWEGFSMTNWYANNRCLRKRRPPQDWVSLCQLNTVPARRVEEPA